MGQGSSTMIKYLLLCGESSEDHEHEQNQYETPPLVYSQSCSSRSFLSSTKDNDNSALLLPTLSSSSSGSNSFVDTTTSHVSLPPITPSDFYSEHTIKCDALDHQNLLDSSNSVSISTIIVRSLWEYSPASFSGTSNPHGEKEFVYFPRFGDEYSSVATTESDPPVDQVIEEEEVEEAKVSERGVAIKDNDNYALLIPTLSSSSSGSNSLVDTTTSHISLPPYTPPDFYNEHTIKCDALDHQHLLDSSNSVPSSTITVRSLREYSPASFSGTSNPHGEEEFVYFPRFGDEYSSVATTESDPPVDQVVEDEEEEEKVSERGVAIKDNDNYALLLPTLSSSSSGSNSLVDTTTSHISLPPYTPPDFYNEHTIKCDAFDHQHLLDSSNSVSSSTITVRSLREYSPASFSGTSSSHDEEEFVYFPRFGDEYSSVATTESDPLVDQVVEDEEEEEAKVSERGVAIKEIRRINHYSSNQRILLVGEGDFSFSRSLARAFGSASNIIATSLDSIGFLQKNYGKAMSNIESLKARGCIVLHSVDATQMANSVLIKGMKFDRIIYNFPLAGFFPRESRMASLCRNRALVGGFLKNAKKMISENGEIHITHKSYGFFQEWQLEALALARGLRLVQELHFNLKDYPGYCTKYGFGGDKNFDCCLSKTYKFGLLY